MTKKEMIIRTMCDYPNLNKIEIAERVGCHPSYVNQVENQWLKDTAKDERQTEMFPDVEQACVPSTDTIDAVLTGGSSDYYKLEIDRPTSGGSPYVAECNDIIEALGMNYAEGNILKAVWRHAALRQGRGKPGSTLKYEAEKVVFFGERLVEQVR